MNKPSSPISRELLDSSLAGPELSSFTPGGNELLNCSSVGTELSGSDYVGAQISGSYHNGLKRNQHGHGQYSMSGVHQLYDPPSPYLHTDSQVHQNFYSPPTSGSRALILHQGGSPTNLETGRYQQ